MSKRQTSRTLRHEVAVRFQEAITKRGLSITKAAEELQVTRQALYLYLKEQAMPGGAVLERACRLWDLSLTVNGFSFSSEAFHGEKKISRAEQQLELFRAFAEIRPNQIETKLVKTTGDLFELRVRIKVAG
jgi:transcriptional regulator with XRE-family HTH domain